MDDHERLEEVCQSIGLLLKALASSHSKGLISEATFVEIVLKLESEHVSPGGFTLSASNTLDDWTVFKIRIAGSAEACASFEFLPRTGEFRPVT